MPPGKFDGEKRGATTVDAQQIPDYVQQRLIDNKESEKYSQTLEKESKMRVKTKTTWKRLRN